MPTNAALPPQYVTNIAVDPRGFVRVGGVCVGRRILEGERVIIEFKDRNGRRSVERGAQLIRVPLGVFIRGLTNETK